MRHGSTRSCQILSPDSPDTILYTTHVAPITTKNHPYNLTLHAGLTDDTPILGAVRLSVLTNTIKLSFGDPSSPTTTWEDMRNKPFTPRNQYTFSLAIPSGERRVYEWKGTHDVKNQSAQPERSANRKMEELAFKIDARHLKMVNKESGEVVARFVHDPLVDKGHFGRRGTFEIWRDEGGEGWDRVVMLSSLALQEFLRRGTGAT